MYFAPQTLKPGYGPVWKLRKSLAIKVKLQHNNKDNNIRNNKHSSSNKGTWCS